jgi:hypothetical protein
MPSTVIRSFEYRAESSELDVRFTTGRRYIYHDVPAQAAEAMKAAFAKGRHFNRHVRGRYRFTEVEPEGAQSGAAVLLPDRDEDQQESGEAKQIEPASLLDRYPAEGEKALRKSQQPERSRERQEQPFAGLLPEAQEEQARDQESHGDGTGEEIAEHAPLTPPGPR